VKPDAESFRASGHKRRHVGHGRGGAPSGEESLRADGWALLRGALGKAASPSSGAGKDLAGLGSAAQVLVGSAALLPVIGSLVLVVTYLTVSAIPPQLAFSESVGGLAWRGWLVWLLALGPFLAAWLAAGKPGPPERALTVVFMFGIVVALVTPFPHWAAPLFAMCVLGLWYQHRLGVLWWAPSSANPPSTGVLARWTIVGGLIAVIALGLTPQSGQPVYVVFADPDASRTGWYVQITDSADPMYLLTCSGDQVTAVPKTSTGIKTFGIASMSGASLWDIAWDVIQSRPLPHLGLTPTCPASPPPVS
jgi:hypothetical protein